MSAKITTFFRVNYSYTSPNGSLRQGSRIVKAQNQQEARSIATRDLSKDYDFFKLTKISAIENDNAQKSL